MEQLATFIEGTAAFVKFIKNAPYAHANDAQITSLDDQEERSDVLAPDQWSHADGDGKYQRYGGCQHDCRRAGGNPRRVGSQSMMAN